MHISFSLNESRIAIGWLFSMETIYIFRWGKKHKIIWKDNEAFDLLLK